MATHPATTPGYRGPQEPFINGILREILSHYAGNSYLRVLPGEAEIILVGEYVKLDNGKEVSRTSISEDISIVIGEDFPTDQFDISEKDAFLGTYTAEDVQGSIFDDTRRVLYDTAIQSSGDPGVGFNKKSSKTSFKRFVKASNDGIINSDFYFKGINESPASAFKNAPQVTSFVEDPIHFEIGGATEESGSFFRGEAALKRKPAIGVSIYLNPKHHGYLSDLFYGIENTKQFNVGKIGSSKFVRPPIGVRFVSGSQDIPPLSSSSQNISKTGAVDTPFIDGQAVSRD